MARRTWGWIVLVATVLLVGASASARADDTAWLCHPALASDPCRGDLTTTVVASDGSSRVEQVSADPNPPVDCFYVYPTVSNQLGPNATATADPEVRSIATFQAGRLSQRCRIFAPLYRQVTAIGVSVASQTHDAAPYAVGYADVEAAFREYLARDGGTRGFVLVGHSQGSRVLRALLRRVIDPDPALRARLVSAIIPGANATLADTRHVRPCESATQVGCLVSWSTFDEPPPADARFGRSDTDPVGGALDLPRGDVLCVDPAALVGTSGALHSLVPSAPFAPGVISVLLTRLYGGSPPTAATPWLVPQDHYSGRCETVGGARVLSIAPVGAARHLTPSPDATWGTHLVDLNLLMGDVLELIGRQSTAFALSRRPLAVSLTRVAGGRALRATLTGPPRRSVRLVVRRGGRVVARRVLRLNGRGELHALLRRARPGSYGAALGDLDGALARATSRRVRLNPR